MSLPKVSIITPVLNGAGSIVNCLESVDRQAYSNKEHIIIDGGSTDGTLELSKHGNDLTHIAKENCD